MLCSTGLAALALRGGTLLSAGQAWAFLLDKRIACRASVLPRLQVPTLVGVWVLVCMLIGAFGWLLSRRQANPAMATTQGTLATSTCRRGRGSKREVVREAEREGGEGWCLRQAPAFGCPQKTRPPMQAWRMLDVRMLASTSTVASPP